jgi:hypothetical protein
MLRSSVKQSSEDQCHPRLISRTQILAGSKKLLSCQPQSRQSTIHTLTRAATRYNKMSRFFHGDSSSESSSSDEEELYSEEEAEEKVASDEEDSDEEDEDDDDDSSSEDEDGAKKSGAAKFFRDADSESEESSDEERAKIVKSAKDKRLEELEGTVKLIENGQKINDWGSISAGW